MSALFNKKEKDKNIEKVVEATEVVDIDSVAVVKASKTKSESASLRGKTFIIKPRITEKATDLQMSNNVYTFDVTDSANKKEVGKAIHTLYGVTPEKVRIVPVPSKSIRTKKGGKGVKSGGKKAYIYLRKGDIIEFV